MPLTPHLKKRASGLARILIIQIRRLLNNVLRASSNAVLLYFNLAGELARWLKSRGLFVGGINAATTTSV